MGTNEKVSKRPNVSSNLCIARLVAQRLARSLCSESEQFLVLQTYGIQFKSPGKFRVQIHVKAKR